VKIEEKEAPAHVHWPEWIGCAKMRPYSPAYHPFKWRGFWDFGTGALGDMACHTLNMPFMGLELKDPTSVQAITAGHKGYMYPAWSVITFEFPALGQRGPVQLKWYDGGKKPETSLFQGYAVSSSGVLVIGEKGTLYAPGDYAETPFADPNKEEDKDPKKIRSRLLGVDRPKVEWEKSPGHFEEWVRAIKGEKAARSNFADYAGPLTEVILLGNLAVWAAPQKEEMGKKIEWDAKNLVAKNAPEVAEIVKPVYHNGYML
jgi:predicted dehydrogenase